MKNVRKDFPILERKINGRRLVYLDNAATSQKPKQVLEAIAGYYSNHNANIHRGLHLLSEEATAMYEESRKKIAGFIGANCPEELIFTKGATESLNMVATTWGAANLKKGDTILLGDFEHHSNMVPWLEIAEKTGAEIEYLESDENGEIHLEEVEKKMTGRVKLISLTHASNVLGTIVPIKEICGLATEKGILVSVDGAQAAPHLEINMADLGCDFYSFSAHKMLGPMGVGALWVKREILERLNPYEFGGGMIDEVSYQKATYAAIPARFEAGTPNVAGTVGFAAAADYLEKIGMDDIRQHEIGLNKYLSEKIKEIDGLKVVGPKEPEKRTGLASFSIAGIHAHDVASVLNDYGIAVRAGHHCVMPYHAKIGLTGTTRASFYLYNTEEEIDRLVEGIKKAVEILS
ncbi:MAG TPA: cysteine desulfurase [Candidatus Colwellbacteria bacterium]|nr:cysteine desulfurase [Candidatus Colwellbacteria bacterium]